ncbi:biotin/lipoyl-binding protein [Pedobacter chinensis]|uniref:Biotin/lipoyl-binding protein n=1 Tax=Pedobacter chinensis TaxID=2282421 RepID=A0A369PUN2_9SPHI|nr:biotin/lipoyl-binding protein [Pedobacter chinensis]RDC56361.1 biotin/lipoyl-binding protein [Pedobacter chinensis]
MKKTPHLEIILPVLLLLVLSSCRKKNETINGKLKRETISFTSKVTGRILKLYVEEGQSVKPGDTLAMLDVPEVSAKITQARGAVKATEAQHLLANNGFTENELKQLKAKYSTARQQFDFANKSYARANAMFADSLLSPQAHDESFSKFQSARAQLEAVTAELNEAKKGTRFERKIAALGQQEQAGGVLKEAEIAFSERYIIATNFMAVETITAREGELAVAGYPLFNGYLPGTTWFRFTIPESRIAPYTKGKLITVSVPYARQNFEGKILTIKQMPRYADITTAYPDYEIDDAVYEIKVAPKDGKRAETLLYNATVLLNNL